MTVTALNRPATARPQSAFTSLVRTETVLLVREVLPLAWGIGLPMVLLTIMGLVSHGPEAALGGVSLVAVYVPILISFTVSTFALQGLPGALAGYRERGILRRLNATPVGAGRLLGAQLTVNLAIALLDTVLVLAVGRLAFGVALPGQAAGFLLALLLTCAAMLGLGLLIAALAGTGRVAAAAGTMIFLPLMFFAGLWTPQALMPAGLRTAGQYTPLGASVSALQHATAGQFPSAAGLGVLAAYAVVFGALAWRYFRWE
jgi:ABC-2 type transport system permease protein